MSTSRRTLLTFLGLVPVAAVGSETFREAPDQPKEIQCGANSCTKDSMAAALRKLAEGVESGAIEMSKMKFSSEITASAISTHDITLEFIYLPEVGA